MMRKAMGMAVVLALAVAGCKEDPALSRLETGEEALIYAKDKGRVLMSHMPDGTDEAVSGDVNEIPVGTKVRVIADDKKDMPADMPYTRMVRVTPLEGDHRGSLGTVNRDNLRPIAE